LPKDILICILRRGGWYWLCHWRIFITSASAMRNWEALAWKLLVLRKLQVQLAI